MSSPTADSPPGHHRFSCVSCGGEMAFDAATQALRCGYCGGKTAVDPQQGARPSGAQPREIPVVEGLARAPRGLGAAVRTLRCNDCGATVNLAPHDQTARCTYCASSLVVAVPTDPNLITPESLVPFRITHEQATAAFRAWLKKLWFRPNDLHRAADLDQIVGVYVPYWTFDALVQSQWQAERGWHYYETETYTEEENGRSVTRTRQVQRTRWEHAAGSRQDSYDDVLVCGSRGLSTELADKLCAFDTRALVPYAPGYLAGWRAESYAVDLPAAWSRGQEKISTSQQSRCAGDVGGNTHRGLVVHNQFARETFKHVLLPVHVAAYRYRGKPYRFLVNGQSSEVVGEAPLSYWKIALLIVAILAVIVAIVAIATGGGDDELDEPAPGAVQPYAAPVGK